jgi:hypothetical protein
METEDKDGTEDSANGKVYPETPSPANTARDLSSDDGTNDDSNAFKRTQYGCIDRSLLQRCSQGGDTAENVLVNEDANNYHNYMRPPEITPAAPRPAIARPAIKVGEFFASAQTREPTSRMATEERKTSLDWNVE